MSLRTRERWDYFQSQCITFSNGFIKEAEPFQPVSNLSDISCSPKVSFPLESADWGQFQFTHRALTFHRHLVIATPQIPALHRRGGKPLWHFLLKILFLLYWFLESQEGRRESHPFASRTTPHQRQSPKRGVCALTPPATSPGMHGPRPNHWDTLAGLLFFLENLLFYLENL